MIDGASAARQTAGSIDALDSGRHGKGQAPRVGHLPALPGTGISPRHLPEPGILTLIVTISTQELLREVGQIEVFKLRANIYERAHGLPLDGSELTRLERCRQFRERGKVFPRYWQFDPLRELSGTRT